MISKTTTASPDKKQGLNLKFMAIDPYVESNIVTADEKEIKSQGFIEFGTKNQYPNYIWSLYKTVPTLGSIINSVVDYGAGDEIKSDNTLWKNEKELTDFCRQILLDLAIFNGCYINVCRSKMGNVAKLEVLDYRNVRSDKKNEVFYYSPDFSDEKKTYGRCKTTVYPAFDPEAKTVANSIYFVKGSTHNTYPSPVWAQAVIPCEMEKNINEFSLNEINNGFLSSVLINMNNGIPTDEIKEEITEMFNEKYCGYENAGRPAISFNQDKDHAPTIEKLQVDNLNDRYAATQERAKQQILTAWRCNGNLVGIPTAQGFNAEEYKSSYNLFFKTSVKPLVNLMLNAIDDIMGGKDIVRITPFVVDFGE